MDQQSILDTLKTEGPEAWLAYLDGFKEGEPITGPSMLVIFNYAAWSAKKRISIDWAQVAIRAAELEIPHHQGVEREEILSHAMRLRSWFISKMGSRPHHLVLDKDIILQWLTYGLKFPILTMRDKAIMFGENLKRAKSSQDPEEMRRVAKDLQDLLSIKDRLNTAKVLAECGELPEDPVLHQWLELRELLP